MNRGSLYIVPTPIGNLDDITLRSIEILKSVDIIACEDTRVTGNLLKRLGIDKEMFIYEDARERAVAPILLEKLIVGKSIALVSDAGTPCISDPGFRIVRLCRKEGIEVIPLSGACAFTMALSASGLPSDAFLFVGFLAPKSAARKKFFEDHRDFEHTIIFYESTHRIEKFMEDAYEVYGGERVICVCKEISKLHERFFVNRLSIVRDELKSANTRGEFVILIAPRSFTL